MRETRSKSRRLGVRRAGPGKKKGRSVRKVVAAGKKRNGHQSRAKSYQESEISLDDTQALNVLVSYFENAEAGKEARQKPVDSLSKRLFLGHIIGREGSTDTASGSQGGPAIYWRAAGRQISKVIASKSRDLPVMTNACVTQFLSICVTLSPVF